jgi:probable F420-dependent oxidoreductase
MKTQMPVQLSVGLFSFAAEDPGGWSQLFDDAKLADAAGVDRIVVSDHVVFGERLEEYGKAETGGSAGGKQPTGPDGHWLEPLTTLSVLAGMTSRVRLGTNVILAALRRPVVLAKSAATLDVLSRGRLDLGVGVGWQKEEYDAAGLPFDGRGYLLNHTLEVMQTLWRERRASFDSSLLKFEDIHMMPKPLQAGGVPIWVSGTIRSSTVKRLARFGTGWIPWGPDAVNLRESLPRMKDELESLGKNAETLQVVDQLPIAKDGAGEMDIEATMDRLAPLIEVGVTDFRSTMKALGANRAPDKLHRVVEAFRNVVGRSS